MLPVSKIPKTCGVPLAAPVIFAARDHTPDRKRARPIVGVVLHTTGSGPGLQAIHKRFPPPDARGDLAYAQRLSGVLDFKGHYLVGLAGGIYQVTALDHIAHHTGGASVKHLRKMQLTDTPSGKVFSAPNASGVKPRADGWAARFPGLTNPLDLAPWQPGPDGNRSANACTVGIDLLEPADGIYPAAQVEALARLLRFLRQDLDLPREAVWDHSELDPYARTNGRGLPWDLSARFPYDQLRALL